MSGEGIKHKTDMKIANWTEGMRFAPPVVMTFKHPREVIAKTTTTASPWLKRRDSRTIGNVSFFGTDTFEEAARLAVEGWDEGAGRIERKIVIPRRFDLSVRPTQSLDLAGAFPIVPIFVSGDPECMVDVRPAEHRVGRIHRIYAKSQIASQEKPETLERWGAGLVSVINGLENNGDLVEVHWLSISTPCVVFQEDNNKGPPVQFTVLIKRVGEPVNLPRLAYWLMHVSAQRRIQFALKECLDIEKYYEFQYGFQGGNDNVVLPVSESGKIIEVKETLDAASAVNEILRIINA